jgi:AcrR family transcriptional regulator
VTSAGSAARGGAVRGSADPPPTTLVRAGDDPVAATLLAAAVEVMAAQGYHGTSVRDIAAAAGTSPGLLYQYFASKAALLETMLDRGMDVLIEATETALDVAGDDPAQRLRAVVGAHVRVHLESQRESLLGNSELRSLAGGARSGIVAKRDVQQRTIERVVRDGVRRGAFATEHPREAARVITTACTAVAAWYRPGGDLGADDIVARYQDVALDTVRCAR